MRTIIAGGRDYHLTGADRAWLDELRERLPITLVLSGAARGADTGGAEWARSRGIPVEEHPADWKRYGRSAGPRRNQVMVDVAEALVVFPGGKGTAHVTERARVAGLRVVEAKEDGPADDPAHIGNPKGNPKPSGAAGSFG